MRNLKDVSAETGVDFKTVQTVAGALSQPSRSEPDLVILRHPKLPAEQVIKVARRRAGARFAAGWVEVETNPKLQPEPVEKAAEETKTPTESESKEQPAAEPEKPKRQRRTKPEEQ